MWGALWYSSVLMNLLFHGCWAITGFCRAQTHIHLGVHMGSCTKCTCQCKKYTHNYVTDVTEKHTCVQAFTQGDIDTDLDICMDTRVHTCWHAQIYSPAYSHRYVYVDTERRAVHTDTHTGMYAATHVDMHRIHAIMYMTHGYTHRHRHRYI